jgi:hypothetical protein
MKLKLKDIWASQQAMPKLINLDFANIKAAYWIGRNAKILDAEFTSLNEQRVKLVKEYGVEDKKSNKWNIPAENRAKFDKLFEELLETEVDLNINQISLDMLADVKLSPVDTVAIGFMLKE